MKEIPGYEGRYTISPTGEIYSIKRKIYLKQGADKDGYLCVNLYGDDGKYHRHFVHRLVAIVYVPNPEGKLTVNHIDENKQNNDYTNLEWATMHEQWHHGTRPGRVSESLRKPVRCVETGEIFESVKAAAAAVGSEPTQISRVLVGKCKTHKKLHWEYYYEEANLYN